MRSTTHIFLLFLTLLTAMVSKAQLNHIQWLTVDDGLSQGYIFSIRQDEHGFMWFPSKMGLNKYDGYDFVHYTRYTNDPNSISGNEIQQTFVDSHHMTWYITEVGGLDLYDEALDIFVHFNQNEHSATRISSNVVYWIVQRGDHHYSVCTDAGIDDIQMTPTENNISNTGNILLDRFLSHWKIEITHHDVDAYTLSKLKVGRVQYHGDDYYLFGREIFAKIDWQNGVHIDRLKPTDYFPAYDSVYYKEAVVPVYQASDATWLFFNRTGVWINGVIYPSPSNCPVVREGYAPDAEDNIWVGGEHLMKFDYKQKAWTQLQPLYDEAHRGIYLYNNCVYVDRSGIVWAGTSGHGIYKYQTAAKHFKKIEEFESSSHSLYGLNENNAGHIIAESPGGVYELDLEQGRMVRNLDYSDPKIDFAISGSRTLYQQEDGTYIQLKKSELWLWDEKKQLATQLYHDPGKETFSSFFIDQKKNFWFTSSEGLGCLVHDTRQIEHYPFPFVPQERNWWRMTEAIYNNGIDQYIWLGTYEGLLRFDSGNSTWKHYKNIPGNSNSLALNIVYAICADPINPTRYIWAGTAGSGICRLDQQTDQFITITDKDGLSNNFIYGILSDSKKLWLSTNKGISTYDVSNGNIVRYASADGLQGNEFNRFSYYKMRNGTFMFGGVNGLTYFKPEEIHANAVAPLMVFTDIKINNKSQTSSSSTTHFINAPFAKELDLRYDENIIAFEFAALEFSNPSRNQYKYQLAGLSDEWIEIGTQRIVNFSGLAPGKYTFSVMGSNSDGIWSTESKSIQIMIHPPWWATWWFRLLMVLLIGGLVWTAVRYRINQLKKLQLVRDRIARDLHDEIGSTLSSISIYNDVVKEKVKQTNPEVGPIIQRIATGTQRVQESMSDIVWAINSRYDSFDNVIARMRSVASEISEARGITIQFNSDAHLQGLKLEMEDRKNLFLIFKEALNNALKYSEATHYFITLTKEDHTIQLEVRDQGKGFDTANSKLGNGLTNMQQRSSMLGGTLVISSSVGGGTTVTLRFPNR